MSDDSKTAVVSLLLDRKKPLKHMSPEKKAQLAAIASTNARRRSSLPRNWRSVVVAVCASREWNLTELARALGMSRPTLNKLRAEQPEINDAIEEANENFQSLLTDVIVQKALAGDSNAAMWILGRTNPKFADRPGVAIQNNLTMPPAPPAPMTLEDYERATLPAAPPALDAP